MRAAGPVTAKRTRVVESGMGVPSASTRVAVR
jgi:hypothetical protein